MQIIEDVQVLRQILAAFRQDSIALVPTMGCLHAGHVSLMRKAKRLADVVVVSIYVNPLQFGAGEDFEQYPRKLEDDAKICEQECVDILFCPRNLYADDGAKVTLRVHDLDHILCGVSRPGHFDGVVTVVNMLFNIVQPNLAVFGEKDWQQLAIIRRMVSDLHMPMTIVGGELIREDDGLAMSSRNRYLNKEERQQAWAISQTLREMQDWARQGYDAEYILMQGRKRLQSLGLSPQYLEILNEHTLTPSPKNSQPQPEDRIFVAVQVGQTRLIDNMPLLADSENMA